MRRSGVIIALFVILAAAVGVYALSRKPNQPATPATGPTTTAPNATTPPPSTSAQDNTDQTNQGNTITYGNNGFSPATLTVKRGTTVTIKNDSSRVIQFDSDPHPDHTDDPELNVGTISPGQSKTVTVTTTGSHGYHNHLNTSDTGILVVE